MSEWVIRDATDADMDALRTLWGALEDAQGPHRIFPLAADGDERALTTFRDAIGSEHGRVIVADVDRELVAMATVWFWSNDRGLDPMPIVDLGKVVVLPAWRARGVGNALIDEAEAWGRTLGARYLQAHMFAGNDDGRAFWERRGFVQRYEARVRPILPAGD